MQTRFFRPFLLITAGVLASCGGTETTPQVVAPSDDQEFRGVEELESDLTPLATDCTFSNQGVMNISIESGELAVISKRSVDSAIVVNGSPCGTATSNTVKRVVVAETAGATGDETLILDFLNGTFAPGNAMAAGFQIDMGVGTGDAFKIRGSRNADTFTVGAMGLSFNTDTSRDVTLAGAESITVSSIGGNDTITANGGAGTGTVYTSSVSFYGGDGDDRLTGGSLGDSLYGGEGNDTLIGGDGNDTLYGENGNDTFNEGAMPNGGDTFDGGGGTADVVTYATRTATVTVTMGTGADDGEMSENDDVTSTIEQIISGSGNDTLTGGSGNDTISGGPGDDLISGLGGADTLNGDAGDDVLVGGAGADVLNGGVGDDTFDEESASNGGDTFNGGAGTDLVDYSTRTSSLTVTMDGTAANDGEMGELDNVKGDVENIIGSSVGDTITGNALANVIDGRNGNDVLNGAGGNDTFLQGSTDDGSDQIIGGSGTDTVDYSTRTSSVGVTMDGVAANDGETGEGDDIENDVENILCGDGDDNVTGNALANVISGGDGDDTIHGGTGDDILSGGDDDDHLFGDDGDDTLDGDLGTNVLDCGPGAGDIGRGGGTGCEL